MVLKRGVQVLRHRVAPPELVAILVRVDRLAVRHVRGDDADAIDGGGDEALLLVDETFDAHGDVGHGETVPREDRDAVVRLLSGVVRRVAGGVECGHRKLCILELRFLQAHDVGRVRSEPVEQSRQPHVQRVDVPCDELHRDRASGALGSDESFVLFDGPSMRLVSDGTCASWLPAHEEQTPHRHGEAYSASEFRFAVRLIRDRHAGSNWHAVVHARCLAFGVACDRRCNA
jgi:hypothetical protein